MVGASSAAATFDTTRIAGMACLRCRANTRVMASMPARYSDSAWAESDVSAATTDASALSQVSD